MPPSLTDNSPPLSALHAHKPFIQAQLPSWLSQAPADLRQAFRDSLVSANQSRHALKALVDELQNPDAFARPLLQEALKNRFYGLIEDENALLIREWKNHHLLGLIKNHARTTRQTLLEAALQNFEASEAQPGGMEAGTGIYNVTASVEALTVVSAQSFAELCRDLDLGGQYLSHLQSVLEPVATSVNTRTAAQVLRLFREQVRHAFGVELHLAYMRQELTPRQHLQLQVLQGTGNHLEIQSHLLTFDTVVLPSVLVILAPSIGIPALLYTPDDPVAPLRRHATLTDLAHSLAERLGDPHYLAFFNRLVPLQHQGTLLKTIPANAHSRASLETPVGLTPIHRDLFQAIATHRVAQIKHDAGTLVVSTAAADLMSRQKRLQGYLELGKSLLFFAASFIPIVGQVLLVVSAAQLIDTVYDGFAAWSHGDSTQALNDLLDVVDNIALAVATAGVIRTTGFTANLVKVRLRNRGWRLWSPNLAPYRHADTLPANLAADARGLYQHEQKSYVKLDDQVHAVTSTPDGKQWQLPHPTDPNAYAPPLLSNGVGGWRHAHENAADWDDLKLIKRLGPDATNIQAPAVEPLLLLSGLDKANLRESFDEMVRPPPLLRETVKHFNLEQEINDFDLDRAEGKTVTVHSPLIQFHLLCSLPEWPANRGLKIVDERGNTVLRHGSESSQIQVTQAQLQAGELLHAVERQMPRAQFSKLMPSLYIDYFTNVENLARRLHEAVPQQKQRLLSLLSAPGEQAVTPAEKNLRALKPGLSKTHLEEIVATLGPVERRSLEEEKTLTPPQLGEADQYEQAIRTNRAQAGLFLESMEGRESVPLALHTLEQLPGWPGGRSIEVYDDSNSGPLLGRIGSEQESTRHLLIRQGELYAVQDAQASQLHPPSSLADALEHTLSEPERNAIFSRTGAVTLKQALHKTAQSLLAKPTPARRAPLAPTSSVQASTLALDPLFAEPFPPEAVTLRADGIYQSAPLPSGNYQYYVADNGLYYQVRYTALGWQLVDVRSPFRAYRPYLRKTPQGRWEIDQAKDALPGGMQSSQVPLLIRMESSDEFESAISSSDYESAGEGTVNAQFTPQELRSMRAQRSYQHSQNYRRVYDRANNGRYPLRDLDGRPMRIRSLQTRAKSLTTNATFSSQLIKPYIQWEGYERVAQLYEDKLEVTPFTAAHQKAPEESALIGQATVVTRKPIERGEALGVYGGELVPDFIAAYRQDPYLLDIKAMAPPPAAAPPAFSGDNVLSRINTIFEYAAGTPVRQAATGYNVEAARFDVDTQVGNGPQDRVSLTAFFASEDIPAGTELRWNYQYNEPTVRALFGQLPQATT